MGGVTEVDTALRLNQVGIASGLLKSIVAASDIAIIGNDLDGIMLSWNKGAENIFGYSASETVGSTIDRLLPQDRLKEMRDTLLRIARAEVVPRFESTRQTKDGRLIDVSVTVSSIEDDSGNIIGATQVMRDITEERRLAEALAASACRYRRLFESSKDGILILDAESGEVVDVNPCLIAMLGYSRKELLGKALWDLRLFRNVAGKEDNFAKSKLERFIQYEELPLETAAGKSIEVELASNAYLMDGKQVVQCNLRDVTERRRTEQALRESEEHFRFLNSLADATGPLSDEVQIMNITTRMLGEHLDVSRCAYADVEADGEHFTILHDYTKQCKSVAGEYLLSTFGDRAVLTLGHGHALVIRDADVELEPHQGGDTFASIGVRAIITCPLVKEGKLVAMMAVHQSHSREWSPGEIAIVQEVAQRCWATIESRAAAEKIHQLNIDLELRVAERTKELEASNAELEAFSYSVSHDLRAPMRAVDGFAQAVVEDYGHLLPEEGLRYLRTVRQGTQKMGSLIDDLLTFSRLGRAPLHRQGIKTASLIRGVLDELCGPHLDSRLDFRVGRLPDCSGDPALLRQVWINLLSNAIKFTRECEIAVLEIGCQESDGECVYFVRDNGKGFDMRYASKLFGVFQRFHRAEEFEGTGVGLAIVQRIIHRHGGRIWAQSAVDQGATFYLTLEAKPVA